MARQHGDLRATLVAAAIAEIDEVGPTAVSLRRVAARAGVTHPAVAHHFGDKTGLLTAVAAQGQRELTRSLAAARRRHRAGDSDLLAMGVAYLRFAHEHRAEFEVMHRQDLLHVDDADLAAAHAEAGEELRAGADALAGPAGPPADSPPGTPAGSAPGAPAGSPAGAAEIGLAAWSLVHGFANLWQAGALGTFGLDEAVRRFRRIARDLS